MAFLHWTFFRNLGVSVGVGGLSARCLSCTRTLPPEHSSSDPSVTPCFADRELKPECSRLRDTGSPSTCDSHNVESWPITCPTFNLRVFHENQEPVSQGGAGGLCPCKEQVSHSHSDVFQGVHRVRTVFFLWMRDRNSMRKHLQVDEKETLCP